MKYLIYVLSVLIGLQFPALAGQARVDATLIPRMIIFADPNKSSVKLSPNGKSISYCAPTGATTGIWMAPVSDPSRVRPLTAQADARAQSAVAPYGRNRRHFIDRSVAGDFAYLSTIHDGDVGVVSRSLDDRVWLVGILDGGPMRYFIYTRKPRGVRYLFTEYPAIDHYQLAQRRAVVVTARDGMSVRARGQRPGRIECGIH